MTLEKDSILNFPDAHLKAIFDAHANGKLAFFIGAGFSKLCETDFLKMPNWQDLIDELKKDLDLDAETDFLKIAQMYFLEFGEINYTNKLKSLLPDILEPSNIHDLLFKIYPKYVITTNWDSLLEKSMKNQGLAYDIIKCDADLVHSQLDKKIIKMHGDFQNHNFVFREDDYLRYSYNFPLLENYIKGIFTTHTIVFMGYSYSDLDLKLILKWIENSSRATPPRYLLTKKSSSPQEIYLKNHGITIIQPYSGSSFSYHKLHTDFFSL